MDGAALRHRLSAILAADAAGYSRLMAADEQATVVALDAARQVFIRQVLVHEGRVVDTAGDSVLAVFETAAGAVDAAQAIQLQLAQSLADTPADRRMLFRIGIHLGDVIEKPDGTVYGNGVNVAARLQALAEPGGISISDAVRGALAPRGDRRFDDQGRHAVKNIADPVHVFRLITAGAPTAGADVQRRPRRAVQLAAVLAAGIGLLAAALWIVSLGPWRASTAMAPAQGLRPMSLVIGPIAAQAGDAPGADVAEGLRRDLNAGLSGPSYRNALMLLTPPEVPASGAVGSWVERARGAGARFMLEGSVRREGDGHLAALHMVEIESRAQTWSADLRLNPGGDAAERARATRQLVGQVAGFIFASESRRVLPLPTTQLAPVELMVKARAVYDAKPSLEGIDEAAKLADLALTLNPNFVPALNMKAFLLLNRYDEESKPDHERYALELDALTARMLALDPRDPYSWSSRSYALRFSGRWTSAMQAVDKLAEIEPGSTFAAVEKANLWLYLGQPAEALLLVAAGPVIADGGTWPQILACHAHLLLAQATRAVDACEQALGRDPSLWSAHLYLAAAHANLGNLEQARASLKVVDRMSPGHTVARLRNYRYAAHPDYRRLADEFYYPGLRKAGMPEG